MFCDMFILLYLNPEDTHESFRSIQKSASDSLSLIEAKGGLYAILLQSCVCAIWATIGLSLHL